MDFGILFKRAGQAAAENSPAILAAIGVTGTIATAYLAAKAGFKSVEVLREAEETKKGDFLGDALRKIEEGPEPQGVETMSPEGLTTRDMLEATWKLYLPAAASAAMTIAAIVCAVQISDRRTAAMASAYAVVKEGYAEHRAKTVERIGKKKEQEIRDEIMQDRVKANPVNTTTLVVTAHGKFTFYDAWSGRYFTSSRNSIDAAVNEFNAQVLKDGYGSLSDFYHLIGLDAVTESDYIGWSSDKLLELNHTSVLDSEGFPAAAFEFRVNPDARFASSY